jgi:hypothetical protein
MRNAVVFRLLDPVGKAIAGQPARAAGSAAPS